MTCTGYRPAFQKQLNGTALGPLSCTCYSGAMAGQYDTCGAKHPLGSTVRNLTGDKVGGTTLLQVDGALRKGWGIDLDTRVGSAALTWATFAQYIDGGRAAILQGGYSAIHGTKYAGSATFTGNHAVTVLPGWIVQDPLADGRRAGIYKYVGAAYPQSLVRRFASELVIDPATGRKAGTRVWCSLTRDNSASYRAVVHPTSKTFFVYTVVGDIITGRTIANTGGFSADCTPPRTYRWPAASMSKSLVKLTSGYRKGQYVHSTYAQEVP